MKYRIMFSILYSFIFITSQAQDQTSKKQRLDFAKMFFEVGGSYIPSFIGKDYVNGVKTSFNNSSSIAPYLTWGGFHFWGHAEFYVNIPLSRLSLEENKETDFDLSYSVITGGRLYPWAVKENKIRPYIGLGWGRMKFKQIIKPKENQPILSKDFMLNYEVGVTYNTTYNTKNLGIRLSANYIQDNQWLYPINTTQKSTIEIPPYSIQLGIFYAFDNTKTNNSDINDEWNSFPTSSKLSYGAKKFGDVFVAAGPSSSFSLNSSAYNQNEFSFLKEKLSSKSYFDIAIGYQFNKANMFAALSFRNPEFETSGYEVSQKIKKKSLALEINKYLVDYTGFAPYIGINGAYDHIEYTENVYGSKNTLNFSGFEPGLTFGWDIVPGKTNEALILRTNLRWYPFSEFEVNGGKFNFSQLEYNLIQVVFYPQRLRKKKKH